MNASPPFDSRSPTTGRIRRWCFGVMVASTLGCGVNSGFLHDGSSDQTVHQMAISAERYVRTVLGSSAVPSLLCAVPLGGRLYYKAMGDLNASAKLQPNEVLKNIRTDDDPVCFIILGVRNITISADVYEVTPVDGGGTPHPRVDAAPVTYPAPDPPREHECMDENSCSTGYRCVFTSGGGAGTCRPVAPTNPTRP